MKREKIEIPRPLAKVDDLVMVLNYRKRPAQWVPGKVRSMEYVSGLGKSFYWRYTVVVHTEAGNNCFLTVGDDGIKQP